MGLIGIGIAIAIGIESSQFQAVPFFPVFSLRIFPNAIAISTGISIIHRNQELIFYLPSPVPLPCNASFP